MTASHMTLHSGFTDTRLGVLEYLLANGFTKQVKPSLQPAPPASPVNPPASPVNPPAKPPSTSMPTSAFVPRAAPALGTPVAPNKPVFSSAFNRP